MEAGNYKNIWITAALVLLLLAAANLAAEETHGADDKRLFVLDLLRHLQEQHMPAPGSSRDTLKKADRSDASRRQQLGGSSSVSQLLTALGADGDVKRLLDWVQSGLNLATVGELTTQFVVGKLASVNCPALLQPDSEDQLMPRFLLFNEHFTDVPFELPPVPSTVDCLSRGHFDPRRKTLVLIHGFLSGYTLLDGFTNIKNQLLDMSRWARDRSMSAMSAMSDSNNGSYVLLDDLEQKIRSQQYNVIVVDWFQGANPVPRARYIRSAVNAQVVGRLIARFLVGLVEQCRTSADQIQILAHSLGCHVAGFTGKAMNAAGHRLGQITHLDPIGLCFGRLFSEPHLRLSPNDALETRAVHVSLNLYDNPLDGAHSNFLVNGGRDQIGCGDHSEVKNSTTSSVSLLFDSQARFAPCSHLRALALFEDDHSSEPAKCQIVGYRCSSYDRFLAGKCGHCDAFNSQCRLMSFQPISLSFRALDIPQAHRLATTTPQPGSRYRQQTTSMARHENATASVLKQHGNGSIAWLVQDKELNHQIGSSVAKMKPDFLDGNDLAMSKRSDEFAGRSGGLLLPAERIAQALDKIRTGTKNALVDGWATLAGANQAAPPPQLDHYQLDQDQDPLHNHQTLTEHPPTPSPVLVGGQQLPPGAINGPLYFVGTSSISPYCVNYYQFRVLIAESRVKRLLQSDQSLAQPTSSQVHPPVPVPPPSPTTSKHNVLHLTVKLTDSSGHFFKGFSLVENVNSLTRASPGSGLARGEPMLELTMLLNTTKAEPVRISETIISYYFHRIVLADTVEVNYMSNISPEIRARHSSLLCPVAINDQHQLVRYMECDKIGARRR